MEKRYQVFVSSTYEDLREERQEVMHALLEFDCIPAGMELFPAANEDQWTLIKRVIDESDYYVLISAGRYGSIGPDGLSYTEMEYRYALEKGKPTIAFLHSDLTQLKSIRCEQTDDGKRKLEFFRSDVKHRVCKFWSTAAELGSVVSRGLIRLTKSNPATGWIRADQINDGAAAPEILKLKRKIEDLEQSLREARLSAPIGAENLAQGNEPYEIDFTFESYDQKGVVWKWNYHVDVSWNRIFYEVGPATLSEANDSTLRSTLSRLVRDQSKPHRSIDKDLAGHTRFHGFAISEHDLQTIKIQLRALGLITKSERQRSVKDNFTYWVLTPYGDQILTTLRAIHKDDLLDFSAIESTDDEPAEMA